MSLFDLPRTVHPILTHHRYRWNVRLLLATPEATFSTETGGNGKGKQKTDELNNARWKPDYKGIATEMTKLPVGEEMEAGEIAKKLGRSPQSIGRMLRKGKRKTDKVAFKNETSINYEVNQAIQRVLVEAGLAKS